MVLPYRASIARGRDGESGRRNGLAELAGDEPAGIAGGGVEHAMTKPLDGCLHTVFGRATADMARSMAT